MYNLKHLNEVPEGRNVSSHNWLHFEVIRLTQAEAAADSTNTILRGRAKHQNQLNNVQDTRSNQTDI